MKHISTQSTNWISRTKEDIRILDEAGQQAVINRLWQKLAKTKDDLRSLYSSNAEFQGSILEYLYERDSVDLCTFVQNRTNEIVFIG